MFNKKSIDASAILCDSKNPKIYYETQAHSPELPR